MRAPGVASAAGWLPGFGAVLLDLKRVTSLRADPHELAAAWLEKLPLMPCALLRGDTCPAAFGHKLAIRLAMAPGQPTLSRTFSGDDSAAALQWCRDRAVTSRDE